MLSPALAWLLLGRESAAGTSKTIHPERPRRCPPQCQGERHRWREQATRAQSALRSARDLSFLDLADESPII
jgi:hypothetical protein